MVLLLQCLLRIWYWDFIISRNQKEYGRSKSERGRNDVLFSRRGDYCALNEGQLDIHAGIKLRTEDVDDEGNVITQIIETTTGRTIFNQIVPQEVGFVNDILTKKALRDIISKVLAVCGTARTAQFLDDIKGLRLSPWHFKGGLSFVLDDVIIPPEKEVKWLKKPTKKLKK
jgi:DNA-directed RNA polymerase subunit beta'